jgi:hypothetical protein
MPKTLSGWKKVHTKTYKGAIAHYKETVTYGVGVVTDCLFSEFGDAITTENVPKPPAGVDFTVQFIQNNTMSAAGDIVLLGAEESGGTFAVLKDDLVAYAAAASSAGQATAAVYVQQPNQTPTGGMMPVLKFQQDDDGLHSASTGTDKTAEIHIFWRIP